MKMSPVFPRSARKNSDRKSGPLPNSPRYTDKAEIKPESDTALTEMDTAINAAPNKKFLIDGHTDNQGALDHNQELSKRRAVSVAATLAAK